MKNASSKRIYFYISTSLILCYFIFVLLMYNSDLLPELYTLSNVSMYYIVIYSILGSVSYFIDTQSKKEAGFLSLFSLSTHSFIFLLGMMFLAKVYWIYILILIVSFILIFTLGFLVYKRIMPKILLIKNGYENITLLYTIIHVFLVLLVVFIMLNLL